MDCYLLPVRIRLEYAAGIMTPCYRHAVAELERLLRRLDRQVERVSQPEFGAACWLRLGQLELPSASLAGVRDDGFVLAGGPAGAVIGARTAKGTLNGVYRLAEELGFLFLLPGEAGEWPPEQPATAALPLGERLCNPRFKYRGVFYGALPFQDYPEPEWLRFYAKLGFNAICNHGRDEVPLTAELGLRFEVGGHGLAKCVPRELFEQEPELFRMFQPEDFGGRRQKDSNLCVTHPRAQRLVRENYAKRLAQLPGAYAVHAWPDDLPAGGWCLCPSCRALPPADQAMLAMRLEAAAVADSGRPMRVPVLAYHDTMFPGRQIAPPPEAFLLFAPRERCYGHRLDDPGCARNRHYLQALEAWVAAFAGIDDAHTFEYYCDQILYRGLYPFLPDVILADMQVYARAGIESHMVLQIAGPAIAPEFNLLAFARGMWDEALTPAALVTSLARALAPAAPQVWERYLTRRAAASTSAMRLCEHNVDIYLDYRWLPETVHPFGREMAAAYAATAGELLAAAAELEAAVTAAWPERARQMVANEVRRARFEAAEFQVMAHQQHAMNALAEFHNSGSQATLREALAELAAASAAFGPARERAVELGIPEKNWYFGNINRWLGREFQQKHARYSLALTPERPG